MEGYKMNKMKGFLIFWICLVFAVALTGKKEPVRAEECQHEYDFDCDALCNLCGELREVRHNYDYENYGWDEHVHWFPCECGDKLQKVIHSYDYDKDPDCYCGFVRCLNHQYVTMKSDGVYHWMECECGEKRDLTYHVYDSEDATSCLVCKEKKAAYYNGEKRVERNGVVYLSLEEAAGYMREQMVERVLDYTISFYFEEDRYLTDGQIWDILYLEAVKYTGKGTEGDILEWCWEQMGHDMLEEFEDGVYYVTSPYFITNYYSSAEQEQELNAEITRVLDELGIDKMSDYEKVKAIYTYICDNVSYTDEILFNLFEYGSEEAGYSRTAYGALLRKRAVCQGYASLVYRMMLEAGIECHMIIGEDHGWNIVKLDGSFYLLDATWDAGQEEFRYFLNVR